ncbi:hypothetical protein ILUMI_10834 [Ignelater luminosus]|uniref:Uncharacterized protein n=1 Tax=Ignelater luminosus TaxID=2038154 RepID=A0A8K0D1D5_IGNLU|nr:hypothetical protein ILUMI_10834 [Ignelater luminosus]
MPKAMILGVALVFGAIQLTLCDREHKRDYCFNYSGGSRLRRIQDNLVKHGYSPKAKRGKRTNRPNELPEELQHLIKYRFRSRRSYYSSRVNSNCKYLNEELAVSLATDALAKIKTVAWRHSYLADDQDFNSIGIKKKKLSAEVEEDWDEIIREGRNKPSPFNLIKLT